MDDRDDGDVVCIGEDYGGVDDDKGEDENTDVDNEGDDVNDGSLILSYIHWLEKLGEKVMKCPLVWFSYLMCYTIKSPQQIKWGTDTKTNPFFPSLIQLPPFTHSARALAPSLNFPVFLFSFQTCLFGFCCCFLFVPFPLFHHRVAKESNHKADSK